MGRVLVTGGCGFIGSHLCDALVASGHDIRVLDDLSTGSTLNLVKGAELREGDVADASAVQAAMEGVDACFHLAAIASVQRGTEAWLDTHRVNLSGTINVFDAARARAVPVVYASSAAVYGAPIATPLTEESPLRPLSAYGADKLGCEQHARVAGVVHGVPTFGLRFFNVFGPRQDPHSPYSGVISIFCERLSRGEPVMIHGDGGQTRDFVHVTDVVAALLAALSRASVEAPVSNVCTGSATTVLELAHAIGRVVGKPPQVRHGEARAGDIRASVGSPRRLEALLGVVARTPLEQGLASIRDWLEAGAPRLRAARQPSVNWPSAIISSQMATDAAAIEATAIRRDQR